jgi:hypothetical protein
LDSKTLSKVVDAALRNQDDAGDLTPLSQAGTGWPWCPLDP